MSGSLMGGAGVNPSIEAVPTQAPMGINGLVGMAGQLANTQNAMNQNTQFQMQFQARQAIGPILQQAIGPDGQLDYNKAFVGIASNPATAFLAQDFLNNAVARQQTQAQTALTQLQTAQGQYKNVADAASGLLAMGPSVGKADVARVLAEGAAEGRWPKSMALNFYANLPDPTPVTGPDGKTVYPLYEALRRTNLTAQGALNASKTVYGSTQMPSLGGYTQPVATSPFMGTTTPLGKGLVHTPTTAELNAPTGIVDITGMTHLIPQAAAQSMVTGAAPGQTPTIIPGTGIGTGQPAGPMTGLPIAVAAAAKGQGPVGTYETNLNGAAAEALRVNQTLKQAQAAYNSLGPSGTGGGAAIRTQMAQIAQGLGATKAQINAIQGGQGPDALAAAQIVMKTAIQTAANNAVAALKSRITGMEFGTFAGQGNPNLGTDPVAYNHMLNFVQDLNNLTLQEQQVFNQFKQSPAYLKNPTGFPAYWNNYLQRTGILDKIQKDNALAHAAWEGK